MKWERHQSADERNTGVGKAFIQLGYGDDGLVISAIAVRIRPINTESARSSTSLAEIGRTTIRPELFSMVTMLRKSLGSAGRTCHSFERPVIFKSRVIEPCSSGIGLG